MLKPLFGSETREKVLIFLLARERGHPTEIAKFFKTSLRPVQVQLDVLENGSVLAGRSIGRTRSYEFNPGYVFLRWIRPYLLPGKMSLTSKGSDAGPMKKANPRSKAAHLRLPKREDV